MALINSLLEWLDASPARFWTFGGFVYALLFALCLWPFVEKAKKSLLHAVPWRWVNGDATFLIALTAVLFVFRWPLFFYPHHLNPDESGFISQALTLRRDPVFWRSVARGSTGPLNMYPLMIPALFGLPINFITARVVGLFLVSGAHVF